MQLYVNYRFLYSSAMGLTVILGRSCRDRVKNAIASLFVSVSSSNDNFRRWPEVIELAELKCGSECAYSLRTKCIYLI